MGVWLQFGRGGAVWEGRGGMGKKKKEKQRKRVSADRWAYNGFFRWNHRRITSVGDSIGDSVGDSIDDSVGESVTSLYGYVSLNPSVILSVKSFDVTTPLHFPDKLYTPSGLCRRYIPTDFETELFSSVIITDGKIMLVIPLVFSDFLVVIYMYVCMYAWKPY